MLTYQRLHHRIDIVIFDGSTLGLASVTELGKGRVMSNPTIFSYRTIDRIGSIATPELFVAYDGATETVDALIGTWLATGALIDAATSSQIQGGQITIPLNPDGSWKSAPASTGNKNNEVININFENAANRYVTEFLLPAYLDAMISNGKVLLTQTQLAALIANIISTAGTADYQSRDLQQLTGVRDAFLTQRKRRGQRARTMSLG